MLIKKNKTINLFFKIDKKEMKMRTKQ